VQEPAQVGDGPQLQRDAPGAAGGRERLPQLLLRSLEHALEAVDLRLPEALVPAFERFEGFDTPDLQAACTLLAAIRSVSTAD
jgi:hypothetical protein